MAKSELTKHTMNLFEGDFDKLQDLCPDLGASVVIRQLVRNYIQTLESGDSVPKVGVQL